MPDKDLNQFPVRLQLLNKLIMRFSADYKQMLQYYDHAQKIELTEHLLKAVGYVRS